MPKTSSRAGANGLPARRIVKAAADAARRWSDADFPARVRIAAAIEQRTGYTAPVVEFALDRLFGKIDAVELEAAIAEELGTLDALDGFVEHAGGGHARAYPAGRVVVISSDTTIGVSIVPAIFALCAKCDVLVKDRADALVAAFFATLAEELPELRVAATAEHWSGGEDGAEDLRLRLADTIVAFGRNETLERIRSRARPAARFVGYGHRASAGYLTGTALGSEDQAREAARGAARDLIMYDGEGCMSLHVLFVERGGAVDPAAFCALLLEAVTTAAIEFPFGRIDPRVLSYQSGAAFRAALGKGAVFRTVDGGATIVLDPSLGTPPPFLPRVLPVYSIDGLDDCEEYIRSHGIPIEVFAVAASDESLTALAARVGAARLTRFGEMQEPSPIRRHGGRARIADFVHWVESF